MGFWFQHVSHWLSVGFEEPLLSASFTLAFGVLLGEGSFDLHLPLSPGRVILFCAEVLQHLSSKLPLFSFPCALHVKIYREGGRFVSILKERSSF